MKVCIPMLAITQHGGNRVLIDLANALISHGYDVEIVSTTKNLSTYEISTSVNIINVLSWVKPKKIRFILFVLLLPIYLRRSDFIVSNHFLTFFPNEIFSYFSGAKNLFFIQGIEADCMPIKNKYIKSFLMKLNRYAFTFNKNIPANQFLSEFVSDYGKVLINFSLGVSKKNLLKLEDINTHKDYDVVYFGRSEKNKGIERFLEIVEINSSLNVLFITQDVELIDLYKNMPNLTIVTPKSDIELYGYIDRAKLCLLTSYKEGFALPPLECMFRGVPLIYFECGGPSIYCNELNSVMIDASKQFDNAMAKIYRDYNNYANAALETASKFVLDESLTDFCEKIREL